MNGAAYWEERERAKKAALKMAANLSARDKGLVVTATRRGLANDVAHDQTNQRSFERGCGRDMRRTLRAIDAPYWEHVRELRFWNALYKLRNYPELQKTLRAIRRHRVRRKNFSALKIGANVYRERFSRLTKILGILT